MAIELNSLRNRILIQSGNRPEGPEVEPPKDDIPTPPPVVPEDKPVTASSQEVLALLAQGDVRFLAKTGGSSSLPTRYSYQDIRSQVILEQDNSGIRYQAVTTDDDVINIEDILIKAGDQQQGGTTGNTSGVNGEIDEYVIQSYKTGDCWLLTGVLSLVSSEIGQAVLKESIIPNSDGSVTVTFKGLGVSYTITKEEIEKWDTDNYYRDAYSNGDNDMLVLELATEKLKDDIDKGIIQIDPNLEYQYTVGSTDKSEQGAGASITGGYSEQIIYFLTGKTSEAFSSMDDKNIVTYDDLYTALSEGLTETQVLEILQDAYDNGNSALTFGMFGCKDYPAPHRARCTDGKMFSFDFTKYEEWGGHAFAITGLTANTVTFVNPWDSSKEYTMTWAEFAKLGIGDITVTDLSDVKVEGNEEDEGDTTPELDPIDPIPDPVPEPEEKIIYKWFQIASLPPSVRNKFFDDVIENDRIVGYTLKSPYTEFEFNGEDTTEEFSDGTSIVVDKTFSVSYTNENGEKITDSIKFYNLQSLNSFLGGDWWYQDGLAEEYFDNSISGFVLKEGKSLEELKQKAPYNKELGFETAEKARAAYVSKWGGKMRDEIFDKYFEIVQLPNGRYNIATKEGFTFVDKQEKSYTFEQYGWMDDGTPVIVPITREFSVYTIRSEDGYDIQITFGDAKGYPSVDILDANGNPIDDDGSIDQESIDAIVIPGYADNGYIHAEEHSAKGRNAVQEMKDKAKELLNTPEFKNQLRAQYKAIIAAAGEVYNEIKFEYLYNRAVATTLLDESVIEVSGSGKKTRATFNVSILVWSFLDNADDFLRAGEHA